MYIIAIMVLHLISDILAPGWPKCKDAKYPVAESSDWHRLPRANPV